MKAREVLMLAQRFRDRDKAARRAALEEAAQVCEKILGPHEYSGQDVDCYQETANRCAAAIRALTNGGE